MNWMINLYAKSSGMWATIVDLLPLLGAVGSILGALSSMAGRASQSKDAATFIQAIHPTASEMAEISVGIGLIKSHFNSQNHDIQIAAVQNGQNTQK